MEKIWGAYWVDDSEHLFVESFKDKTDLLPDKFYLHKVGTSADQDILLYKENDESFFINNVIKTADGKYLLLLVLNDSQSETWLLDLANIRAGFKLFSIRQKDHSYLPYIYKDEYLSEDWALCQRAEDLGFEIWAHGGVRCAHWGLIKYDFEEVT